MDCREGGRQVIEPRGAVFARGPAIAQVHGFARVWVGAGLLLLLFFGGAVSPAPAIEHYTDAQGTIHIKNDASKSKPTTEAVNPPTAPQPPPSVLRRPGPPGANPHPEQPGVSASGAPSPPHVHHPVPPGAPPAATGPKFGSHQLRHAPPPAPPAAAPGLPPPPQPPGAPGGE
jgi:hypothetical protein